MGLLFFVVLFFLLFLVVLFLFVYCRGGLFCRLVFLVVLILVSSRLLFVVLRRSGGLLVLLGFCFLGLLLFFLGRLGFLLLCFYLVVLL